MKNKNFALILAVSAILFAGVQVQASYNVGVAIRPLEKPKKKRLLGACSPASSQVDLDVNNVRARIMNGGDMWWDLVSTAKYEVPKITQANEVRKTSLFAGALWIGGYERSNLKEAAMTYRQNGSDFYPGPLDTTSATTDAAHCTQYDKIWKLNKEDIDNFRKGAGAKDDITNWPGNPIDPGHNEGHFLAPFVDVNHNGIYDPIPEGGDKSDYPDIKGDQALWFVYNDVGSIHNETQAAPIGLELRTMAFGFVTNDQISNMTFYYNTIINRGKSRLDSTYFGEWVDADLGYAFDDYVGCDTTRDLGICYNGNNIDPGLTGYGVNPPCVGVDFFQGPIDDKGKQLGMAKFVYYNNDFTVQGNPEKPEHYYYYLTGKWKDGKAITKGGNGRTFSTIKTNYMFPGNPLKNGVNDWTEGNPGAGLQKNPVGDRRFLQSAGPFTLKPGAVNHVTVGVVWARASSGGPLGGYNELLYADDLAQRLYENNFQPVIGPQPPVVDVTELDQKIVLSFINQQHSIDTTEKFDKYFPSGVSGKKLHYRFEGYQIYQVRNSSITSAELEDPNKARQVAQVDLKNDIVKLVNSRFDRDLTTVKVLKVSGENSGISHSFEINKDAFASGDDKLLNNKFYYFVVQAYAADTTTGTAEPYLSGKASKVSGVEQIKCVPHKRNYISTNSSYGSGVTVVRLEGTGNGGVDLDFTDETSKSFFSPILKSFVENPVYKTGKGPVNVKVIDPSLVPNADFEVRIIDSNMKTTQLNGKDLMRNSKWVLTNKTTGVSWNSDVTMNLQNEQVIPELGLALSIYQPYGPGNKLDSLSQTNGSIKTTQENIDLSKLWITSVPDAEQFNQGDYKEFPNPQNWIRAGNYNASSTSPDPDAIRDAYDNNTSKFLDPNAAYENQGFSFGLFAPAALCSKSKSVIVTTPRNFGTCLTMGPLPGNLSIKAAQLANIASVDFVFTADKSKWTKCMVLEMCEDPSLSEGGAAKFELRKHGNPFKMENGLPVYDPDNAAGREEGYSWFPGYALNLETGERLNLIFGEDSHLPSENGNDMLWNPSGHVINIPNLFDYSAYATRYLWGGKHWIYVMASRGGTTTTSGFLPPDKGTAYDECKAYQTVLNGSALYANKIRDIMSSAMYISLPMALKGFINDPSILSMTTPEEGLIPVETKVKLRVQKPYSTLMTSTTPQNNNMPLYKFSTGDIAAVKNDAVNKSALDKIGVVPNPYYAYSQYENS
ncbi:MAG: hypothetical protein NTX03_09160, partial [Bacteroidetes bacterium]|nr:hypothetical protein [Bacteroidota bacterium]